MRGAGRHHWIITTAAWITSWWQDMCTYTETDPFIEFDKNDAVKNRNVIEIGGTTN
jgi:hypothetical protein